MKTIKVALVSPFSSGPARGNMTTVHRIADHLPHSGCLVTTLQLDAVGPMEQRILLKRGSPELLHAFHAYHTGPTARSLSRELGIPYLVTITGSDLFDPEFRSDSSTRLAILDAAAVTCFDPLVADFLTQTFPEVAGMIAVIPQGVAPLPVSEPYPRGDNDYIVLLPAAIRAVKGIRTAIETLTPLAGAFPSLRLLLAGGDLDPDYAAGVREIAASLPWVDMLGDVPHDRMGDLFAASDLVLNCSTFEGGMANTLLEAMVMGKPVLARDVLGNRSLVKHGETGWLYSSQEEFRNWVGRMINDRKLGIETGEAGRTFAQEHCSTVTEAASYRKLYEQLLEVRSITV